MRVYRKAKSIVATILIFLLLFPMGQMSGWAAETDTFPSIDQSRWFPNPDAIMLSLYSEDSGAKGIEDHGIQWTLAFNSIESEQAPARLRLTLSPGHVLSKVMRADSGLLRLTAVLKDGTSRVLYDTEYTLSGPEPKFTSTEVACYEMELDALTEKETIKFFTTFDSDSQTTFEALAELQGETRAKAYERVDLPYREKIDIPVTIQWLDLESEGLPQEATVSLTNPHTGEVFSQTGTEEVLFTRVPKYTSDREEIPYEISQGPIKGYSTTVKDFTITNIKEPDSVETITGLDGTLPSEDTASEPSKTSVNPSAKRSKGTQEIEVPNVEGDDSGAEEQGEAAPGPTEPTIKDDEAEELFPEEDSTPGGSNSEEANTEEEKPPVIEDSSPVEPDELRPPDLFEDGILTGLEILPDPVAPVEVGATKGAAGSGTIVGNLPSETLGSYTWEALAATDGKSVQWTLTVTETGSRSTYNNYMEFKIPDEFDAITADSISIEGESVYPPSNLDAPAGRHWGVYTYGSTSTTNYTLKVSFSTTVADGPNTTLEEFTLPYLPATQRYTSGKYTTFGPTDKNSGGSRLPVTDVAWLQDTTQPKVDNPGYVPPVTSVDFTVNKVDQEQQPLADALFSLTPKADGEIATARSGADGKAIFTEVTPGEYTLKEIEAPPGYTAAPEQEITVSAEKNDITVVNQLIPTSARVTTAARVFKVEGNTAPLAGVVFSLTNDAQTYESTPTDEKGDASFPMPIPFGEYTLSQEPPSGFYPAPAQSVVISEESHHFTMQSTEKSLLGSLRIKIRDMEDPEKPVEGAVIRLTHKGHTTNI